MNHLPRRSSLSLAGAALLAAVLAWAAHAPFASTPSSAEPAAASFGHWIVETFPTPEAGFVRRASGPPDVP